MAMMVDTIERVEEECERLMRRIAEIKSSEAYQRAEQLSRKELLWGGRDAAAVKRASMDLTHALADLRQGR